MVPKSQYGMAIGNLTSQAGSNLNLDKFDKYVTNELKLKKYIRYVDDIIIEKNKKRLLEAIPLIEKELKKTNQKISTKKTKIDTAYHGVPFLGKISYPYGYQKPQKKVIIRTYEKAKNIKYTNIENLLSKINSQIGMLKNYNTRKLIISYAEIIEKITKKVILLNKKEMIFQKAI